MPRKTKRKMQNIAPSHKDYKYKLQLKTSPNDEWSDLKYRRWGKPSKNEFDKKRDAWKTAIQLSATSKANTIYSIRVKKFLK